MAKEWTKYMALLGDHWTRNCDAQSKEEGWTLFNANGVLQIESLDDPAKGEGRLKGRDGEAYALVCQKAMTGSKLHALALFLDGKNADKPTYVPKILVN